MVTAVISPSEIFNKLSRLRAPCATRLHSDMYEQMVVARSIYFIFLFPNAFSAVAPAKFAVAWMCRYPGRLRPTLKVCRATREPALLRRVFYRRIWTIQSALLAGICAFLIARQRRSMCWETTYVTWRTFTTRQTVLTPDVVQASGVV